MLIETLQKIFNRDLEALKSELENYLEEKNIWLVQDGITNSSGNLCLHLIGNLNWFIGAQLGNTGYIRKRELEFSSVNIPREELLASIDETKLVLNEVLDTLTSEQLEAIYPINVFGEEITTSYFLVHLSTHLSYHLGQVNYHRRLLN
jgi:hypothetical protein